VPVTRIDEYERVRAWNQEKLVELGFSGPAAKRLSHTYGVSHHDARRLLHRGCDHATAYRILRGVPLPADDAA